MDLKKRIAITSLAALSLMSCDSVIYDDTHPCDQGVTLRFVYNYNMEWADAFASKVHCLTLMVYDANGNYISKHVGEPDEISQEGYSMKLPLPEGSYHFVAYGGMECEDASYAFDADPAGLKREQRSVSLSTLSSDAVSSSCLHDHFYGSLDLEVTTDKYTNGTVSLVKNTNHFRIMLQQIDGSSLSAADYQMSISDSNSQMAHDNSLLSDTEVRYEPWSLQESPVGTTDDEADWMTVVGELSTSRLSSAHIGSRGSENGARLAITRTEDGETVLDIPLINYLLLFKSDRYDSITDQEFLDRMSEWNMVFFLDKNNQWISSRIVVNGWTVRIDDSNL